MPPPFIQLVLSILAGVVLFLLWRSIANLDRVAGLLTAWALAGRLLLGQLMFWLSHLDRLPQRLNRGDGIWFFAVDANWYMWYARFIASHGPWAVLQQFIAGLTSMHQDLLTFAVYSFGTPASVAILLNAFFATGAAWVLARWSTIGEAARRPARFAIAALMFYPAGVLWSTQPLKDSFVHFLLVVIAGAALLWREAWRENLDRRWAVAAALVICIGLFGVSGIRWYVGFAVVIAFALFLLLVSAQAIGRRTAAALASLVLFPILVVSFYQGGKESIPAELIPRKPAVEIVAAKTAGSPESTIPPPPTPTAFIQYTEVAHYGFSIQSAGTQIDMMGRTSRAARWLGGLVAIIVPRALIERTGLMHIGGGRGLFLFADLDTLLFDLMIACTLVLLWQSRKRMWLTDALFWLVVVAAIGFAVPGLYVITNFGTLFRFRGMIYVIVAILPLIAATTLPRADRGTTRSSA